MFLNVFDLASGLSIPNDILNNTMMKSIGAFHAAVEVYGHEWSFYRTPIDTFCGVCKSLRPRHHPVHVYRQSVNLGQTVFQSWEVHFLVSNKLAPQWIGGKYDLLHRNCIHFCEEFLLSLGVQAVPSWVKCLHESGASLLRPFSFLVDSSNSVERGRGEINDDDDILAGRAPSDGTFIIIGEDEHDKC